MKYVVVTLLLLVSPALAFAHGDDHSHDKPEAATVAAVHEHENHEEAEKDDPLQFGPLKVGLDVMGRAESTNNFTFTDFTFAPENDDQRLLLRLRPSLTLTPVEYLSARVEGQWYAFYNDEDFDKASLYQAYLEGKLPNEMLALKAGRQELVYGSAFLLGADSFFNGLTFEAVKLSLQPAEPLMVDFFAGKYVKAHSDGVEGELYGVYGTYVANDRLGLDLYGLLDTGGDGLFHDSDHERTYSAGARLTGRLGEHVALEVEPVYQQRHRPHRRHERDRRPLGRDGQRSGRRGGERQRSARFYRRCRGRPDRQDQHLPRRSLLPGRQDAGRHQQGCRLRDEPDPHLRLQ